MEIYKVVRKGRGRNRKKYYSAIVISRQNTKRWKCTEYGDFDAVPLRENFPLFGFDTKKSAIDFLNPYEIYEVWKAEATLSEEAGFSFRRFDWPRGTVFCSKIKLVERVEL